MVSVPTVALGPQEARDELGPNWVRIRGVGRELDAECGHPHLNSRTNGFWHGGAA